VTVNNVGLGPSAVGGSLLGVIGPYVTHLIVVSPHLYTIFDVCGDGTGIRSVCGEWNGGEYSEV
jgi:hypothetical protein